MPNRSFKNKEEEIEEEWDPVKELKNLNLEDFLNCEDTREILISEHYYNFEKKLKYKLAYLYEKYNCSFRNEDFFGKDWDNELGESFAELIYNFISINYDLTLFYDCPQLAIDLLSKKNK